VSDIYILKEFIMISESPVVTVHIPPLLRPCVGGHDEVTASGDTVGEVLEAVGHEYPDFRNKVPGEWQPVSRPDRLSWPDQCESLQGLATPVQMEELVSIVPTAAASDYSVPD
jgi:molybdopterin converting factor small subunit